MNQKHDKEAVLKKGLGLFCNKGYNSLGVEEICTVTGMTKGAFYNAFKSKEQFLIEAILLYGDNNVKRIKSELEPKNDVSAFERLQNFYVKMLEAQPKVNYIGCFINNIMSELGVANELVGKVSDIEFNKFIEAIEPTVSEAKKNGEIIEHLDTKILTELIHSTFYGILTRVKSSHDYAQGIITINLLFNSIKNK